MGLTSQDTVSCQPLTAGFLPVCIGMKHLTKDLDLETLQRSPYLDMLNCPTPNGKNPDVTPLVQTCPHAIQGLNLVFGE